MINRIILNETSYFGRGSREKLTEEIEARHFKKILVVTDKSLLKTGTVTMVTDVLDKKQINYHVYDEVKPNPSVKNVQDGVKAAKDNNVDCIVAVGGGSSIDTAKAIAVIMTNPEFSDVVSLDGVAATKNKALPLIALPTTAGTAAEVTINYVITDEVRTKKMVCVDVHDIPVVAIIDPDLMQGMPQKIAASTGMDALTHAMEGYITKAAWLIPDMFHINAMALIYKNLEKAANDKDKEAVEKIGYAQYIAGMGFSNVGLGIVHSMAHSLGAYFDTPHGVANAIILPTVMEYNAPATGTKYKDIAEAMGVDTTGMSQEEYRKAAIDAVKQLSQDVGIPADLKDIVKVEDLDFLSESAYADACRPGNPRETSVEEIKALYKSLL